MGIQHCAAATEEAERAGIPLTVIRFDGYGGIFKRVVHQPNWTDVWLDIDWARQLGQNIEEQ